ncbi:zinc finger CCCH domain-containing protein 53 isoform X3 [Canna indica]|uniref:Zinc finger CCCH domain-containing protein 53 isoform X3 n=1 Tax=Canna indica TaxID=4628 RepID=A0AAQ3KMG7_9LILI|nr:zinc finger CCCH domain-containing protein 53 isoform X3 [Canna indica]
MTENLDAENAAKIMGYILIQDHSIVLKARKELDLANPPLPPASAAAFPATPPGAGAASSSPFSLLTR